MSLQPCELRPLTGILLKLGRLVTQQVRDALEALLEGKGALARMVQRREDWVDELELAAHDRIDALLLKQPAGLELRALLSLGNSVRDLERIGNEAERIARAALDTQARAAGARPPHELWADVAATAALVIEIVEEGLAAIAQLDREPRPGPNVFAFCGPFPLAPAARSSWPTIREDAGP